MNCEEQSSKGNRLNVQQCRMGLEPAQPHLELPVVQRLTNNAEF